METSVLRFCIINRQPSSISGRRIVLCPCECHEWWWFTRVHSRFFGGWSSWKFQFQKLSFQKVSGRWRRLYIGLEEALLQILEQMSEWMNLFHTFRNLFPLLCTNKRSTCEAIKVRKRFTCSGICKVYFLLFISVKFEVGICEVQKRRPKQVKIH